MTNARLLAIAIAATLLLGASSARAEGLQDDVDQAVSIIEDFQKIPEKGIPREIMANAKGLAILTVTKAGFIISGRGGKGVVVARLEGGKWSGPAGIGTGGAGFGFQAGVEVTDFVIVLNSPAAVKAFSLGGNFTIGGQLGAAIGPVGRTVGASVAAQAAMYTYSRSQGAFAGVSLEGTVIAARDGANEEYYGRKVTPAEILGGQAKPPAGADKLVHALEAATRQATK